MTFIIEKNYIDGAWADAVNGRTIDVTNPANGKQIGTVPFVSKQEIEKAIEAAHRAFPAWAAKTAYERSEIMARWSRLIGEHQEELAAVMVKENGKPLAEARTEVNPSYIQWYAEEAKRVYGRIIPSQFENRQLQVIKQPIGVAAMITPWNFPASMITRKAGAALAAGCTVVLKPDHRTPYSALALAKLAEEAGIPKGVFNVITGDAEEIGKIFTSHKLVRKISFTGSTRVGKLLMEQSAPTLKKLSLELGGNAPFIVFESSKIDMAIDELFKAKIRNAGQTCVSPNRIYVQDSIHDAFVEKLVVRMKGLKVGDGFEEGVQVGPLIDQNGFDKVKRLVDDAIAHGATCILGGKQHRLGGTFFEPTILTGITTDMTISCEEIFGPVMAIQKFNTEEEAIRLANDTVYGLASYVMTNDLGQSQRVAKAIEYGMVGMNTGLISTAQAPFGGVKESGLHREGGIEGVDAYLETKYIAIQSPAS